MTKAALLCTPFKAQHRIHFKKLFISFSLLLLLSSLPFLAECLQDAILKSSKNIKARTSFAIVKANYINSMKANKSVLLTSHYAGSSMSSFVVFDMTKKNEAHSSEKDPSKMVATLVAVSIFVISALLVVVTWKRKNKYVI